MPGLYFLRHLLARSFTSSGIPCLTLHNTTDAKHYCHQLCTNVFGNVWELVWIQADISNCSGEMMLVMLLWANMLTMSFLQLNHVQSIFHVIRCQTCTKSILLFNVHRRSKQKFLAKIWVFPMLFHNLTFHRPLGTPSLNEDLKQ